MQVSWIDPDEIRVLLTQLEGPKQASTDSAWEVHTLPVTQVPPLEVEPLLGDSTLPQPPQLDDSIAEERPAGPANAELWRIRERLKALRDKAHSAGIFSRSRPTAPPPEFPNAKVPLEQTPATPAPEPESKDVVPSEPVTIDEPEPVVIAEPSPILEEAPPEPEPRPEPPAPPIQSPFELTEASSPVFEPLFGAPVDTPAAVVPIQAVVPKPAQETNAVPFTVPNQGLSERLNAIAEWVCARLGTREVLLVDDYGDVLWGSQGQTALVLSAVMAWHSAQRSSASATCIDPERIDKALPPDRALTVLPLRTRYGVVSLAVIQRQPVGEDDAAIIRQALALAVEGPSSSNGNDGA